MAQPEDVGVSSARLAKIAAWQQKLVSDERVAMTQCMVARHGRVVHDVCTGSQSPGVPATPDSIYRIYSMTKPIVSAALHMLVEEGKLLIRDPVHLYLGPKWRKSNMRVLVPGSYSNGSYKTVACDHSITVFMLLTHTSGLSYGFDATGEFNQLDKIYCDNKIPARGAISRAASPLGQWVDALAEMPLMFQPGAHWNYSYSTDVVGRLVEVVSGQPLDAFLQKRILGPLRMVDTSFFVPESKRGRFCRNYMRKGVKPGMLSQGSVKGEDRGLEDITDAPGLGGPRYRDVDGAFLSGGGGLTGTARDYMRFAQMLANGGELDGELILSRKTVEWMTSNHLRKGPTPVDIISMTVGGYSEIVGEGVGFGLGVSVTVDVPRTKMMGSPGLFGWGGAASTQFWVDPQEDLCVVFMTQHMYRDDTRMPLRSQLNSLVYATLRSDLLRAPPQRARPQSRL